VSMAQSLLTHLGLPKETIDILYLESLREGMPVLCEQPLGLKLGDLIGNKRERLFTALDALAETLNAQPSVQPLSISAPYGTIECQASDCTLCMSCVAVCPTRALHPAGDSPALRFIEQDCVQCGLCVK
ncbi:(Fe-S)-binding protein, partial [Vibrio cholerae]